MALIATAIPAVAQRRPTGLTYISASSALSNVLSGGVPRNLNELRALERQQQAVAARIDKCTVSVQIGMAQGSGVIITKSGYVFTAAHVAMRPGQIAELTLSDGRKVRATTLGMNRFVDAGLIKIDDPPPEGGWPFVTLGSSKDLAQGTWCIAAGHPGGYDPKRGVVIRIGRVLSIRDSALVTDCALIGGDSGGPLFDLNGQLIGVHSRIGNDVTDNLHVPIDRYDESWTRLARGELWGHLPGFRPRIGVRRAEGRDEAVIGYVAPESAAAEAGIKAGDTILRFGDAIVSDFDALVTAVANTMPGEHVYVVFLRNGQKRRVMLVVGRDPNS